MLRRCSHQLYCLNVLPRLYSSVAASGQNFVGITPEQGVLLAQEKRQMVKPVPVYLTNEDYGDKDDAYPLFCEGSPSMMSQMKVLNYSMQMASQFLQSGDDIADFYVFKKIYKKHFRIPEDQVLQSVDKRVDSPKSLSCVIRLANEKRTKIFLNWIPSSLSMTAIHKIITGVTGNENYVTYVYNVANKVRILIYSEATSANVPRHIELQNTDSEEVTLLAVYTTSLGVRKTYGVKKNYVKKSQKDESLIYF